MNKYVVTIISKIRKNQYWCKMKICKLVVENLGFYTLTLSTSFNSFIPKSYI